MQPEIENFNLNSTDGFTYAQKIENGWSVHFNSRPDPIIIPFHTELSDFLDYVDIKETATPTVVRLEDGNDKLKFQNLINPFLNIINLLLVPPQDQTEWDDFFEEFFVDKLRRPSKLYEGSLAKAPHISNYSVITAISGLLSSMADVAVEYVSTCCDEGKDSQAMCDEFYLQLRGWKDRGSFSYVDYLKYAVEEMQRLRNNKGETSVPINADLPVVTETLRTKSSRKKHKKHKKHKKNVDNVSDVKQKSKPIIKVTPTDSVETSVVEEEVNPQDEKPIENRLLKQQQQDRDTKVHSLKKAVLIDLMETTPIQSKKGALVNPGELLVEQQAATENPPLNNGVSPSVSKNVTTSTGTIPVKPKASADLVDLIPTPVELLQQVVGDELNHESDNDDVIQPAGQQSEPVIPKTSLEEKPGTQKFEGQDNLNVDDLSEEARSYEPDADEKPKQKPLKQQQQVSAAEVHSLRQAGLRNLMVTILAQSEQSDYSKVKTADELFRKSGDAVALLIKLYKDLDLTRENMEFREDCKGRVFKLFNDCPAVDGVQIIKRHIEKTITERLQQNDVARVTPLEIDTVRRQPEILSKDVESDIPENPTIISNGIDTDSDTDKEDYSPLHEIENKDLKKYSDDTANVSLPLQISRLKRKVLRFERALTKVFEDKNVFNGIDNLTESDLTVRLNNAKIKSGCNVEEKSLIEGYVSAKRELKERQEELEKEPVVSEETDISLGSVSPETEQATPYDNWVSSNDKFFASDSDGDELKSLAISTLKKLTKSIVSSNSNYLDYKEFFRLLKSCCGDLTAENIDSCLASLPSGGSATNGFKFLKALQKFELYAYQQILKESCESSSKGDPKNTLESSSKGDPKNTLKNTLKDKAIKVHKEIEALRTDDKFLNHPDTFMVEGNMGKLITLSKLTAKAVNNPIAVEVNSYEDAMNDVKCGKQSNKMEGVASAATLFFGAFQIVAGVIGICVGTGLLPIFGAGLPLIIASSLLVASGVATVAGVGVPLALDSRSEGVKGAADNFFSIFENTKSPGDKRDQETKDAVETTGVILDDSDSLSEFEEQSRGLDSSATLG